jgi:hypothetical protein
MTTETLDTALTGLDVSCDLGTARHAVTEAFGHPTTGTDVRAHQLISLAVFASARNRLGAALPEGRVVVPDGRMLGWAGRGGTRC